MIAVKARTIQIAVLENMASYAIEARNAFLLVE